MTVARRLLRNPLGLVSSAVLALIVLFGLSAPFLAPYDANLVRPELTNVGPFSSDFLLGGDQAGRDILSRLMYATRDTLSASLVMLAVSLGLGVITGLLAGYFDGWFDALSSWVANAVMALPGVVLLIALYTVIGPSITTAMAVFGVLIAPAYFRLVRTLVRAVRQELYVDAAKVSGLPDCRIIFRHVLRAVRAPIIIQSSFVLAAGIAIQAGLEFLGLGDSRSASWGGMLDDAFNNMYIARLNVLWPAAMITLTTLCLVLLGNALRDVLQEGRSQARPLRPRDVARLQAQHRAQLQAQHRADRQAGRRAQPEHEPPGTPGPPGTSQFPKAPRPPEAHEPPEPPEAPERLLSIRDLVVAYPTADQADGPVRAVVLGLDLDVRRGEILGLVGESGSGKTQTAFAALGILPREAVVLGGRITFDGLDLRDPDVLRRVRGRRVGYVPQEPMSNLDPMFSIGAQLAYGLRAAKPMSKAQARRELLDLLARVGIKDPERVYRSYPHQISGGMAQRVLIAGAIAPGPDLVIADEPTTALDVSVQAEVLELIRELQRERDLTMILVTHNFGVVADVCDRVSVMKEGLVVETNDVRRLFAHPRHDYTRVLLESTLDGSLVREPLPEPLGEPLPEEAGA